MSFLESVFTSHPLKKKILQIKKAIKRTASSASDESVTILWYGAYDIDPKHLIYWITIKSDNQKNRLESDKELHRKLRNLLIEYDYPENARDSVGIEFESQETVDRESNGNWYHHFK
ncbi:MAG TPA: hypothetical protein VNW51_01180 [Mucilaginibacter sp.]|jgi:hypothetical protein|nr:hypothetical protein [Mucilaginibacter sp.]